MCFWKPLDLNSFSWNWKLHLETYDKACVYACYILAMCSVQSPNIYSTERTKKERQKKRIPSPPPPLRAADKQCKFYSTKKKKVIQLYRMYTTGDRYNQAHKLQACIKA